MSVAFATTASAISAAASSGATSIVGAPVAQARAGRTESSFTAHRAICACYRPPSLLPMLGWTPHDSRERWMIVRNAAPHLAGR